MGKIVYWFKDFIKGTDKILLGLCMILSAIGTVMVYSATRVNLTEDQIISRDAKTMFLAVMMGICVSLVISYFDYEAVTRLWPIIAIICLGLMLSLFVIGSSPEGRDDAISWIKLGSFYFQPSELLKIGFIITFSVHLESVGSEINKLKNVILLGIHAMIAIGLVVLTGDMGSALVFMFITVGMLFMAGLQLRYFLFGAGSVALLAPIAWFEVLSDFQKQRFTAIYAPSNLTEATYNEVIFQQERGMNAISSGGVFGTGLFNGTYTQNGLVPESENDMIFTVVGEELGFVGCMALLLILFFIILKVILNAKNSSEFEDKYICYGVFSMIASQTIVNIGMVLGFLPVVGITLPLFSSGGTSALSTLISLGLVQSVRYHNTDDMNKAFVRRGSSNRIRM